MSNNDADNEHDTVFSVVSLAKPRRHACVYKLVLRPKPSHPPRPTIELEQDYYVLGRSATVDITLDSTELSRKHAVLRREHGSFSIRDLDSTNGVYLNGTRIHAAQLYHGDIIQFGDLAYEFCEWS